MHFLLRLKLHKRVGPNVYAKKPTYHDSQSRDANLKRSNDTTGSTAEQIYHHWVHEEKNHPTKLVHPEHLYEKHSRYQYQSWSQAHYLFASTAWNASGPRRSRVPRKQSSDRSELYNQRSWLLACTNGAALRSSHAKKLGCAQPTKSHAFETRFWDQLSIFPDELQAIGWSIRSHKNLREHDGLSSTLNLLINKHVEKSTQQRFGSWLTTRRKPFQQTTHLFRCNELVLLWFALPSANQRKKNIDICLVTKNKQSVGKRQVYFRKKTAVNLELTKLSRQCLRLFLKSFLARQLAFGLRL